MLHLFLAPNYGFSLNNYKNLTLNCRHAKVIVKCGKMNQSQWRFVESIFRLLSFLYARNDLNIYKNVASVRLFSFIYMF